MANETESKHEVAALISKKVVELSDLAKRAAELGLNTEVEISQYWYKQQVTVVRVWNEDNYVLRDTRNDSLQEAKAEYPQPDSAPWTTQESFGRTKNYPQEL